MEIERTKKVRTAEAGFNPLEDLSTRVGRQRGDGEDHRERERGGDGSDGRHADGSFYSGASFMFYVLCLQSCFCSATRSENASKDLKCIHIGHKSLN